MNIAKSDSSGYRIIEYFVYLLVDGHSNICHYRYQCTALKYTNYGVLLGPRCCSGCSRPKYSLLIVTTSAHVRRFIWPSSEALGGPDEYARPGGLPNEK